MMMPTGWRLRSPALELDTQVELTPAACATIDFLRNLLPLRGAARAGTYAGNQIYFLTQLSTPAPATTITQNLTVVPAATEVVAWVDPTRTVLEIGIFYDDHNLLISPQWGFTPVSVIGRARGLSADSAAEGAAWKRRILAAETATLEMELDALPATSN